MHKPRNGKFAHWTIRIAGLVGLLLFIGAAIMTRMGKPGEVGVLVVYCGLLFLLTCSLFLLIRRMRKGKGGRRAVGSVVAIVFGLLVGAAVPEKLASEGRAADAGYPNLRATEFRVKTLAVFVGAVLGGVLADLGAGRSIALAAVFVLAGPIVVLPLQVFVAMLLPTDILAYQWCTQVPILKPIAAVLSATIAGHCANVKMSSRVVD